SRTEPVRENIQYGKLEASDAEITEALQRIGASDLIKRLEEPVGEEGTNLSLGERQLLALARVILKDPRILIMDEATSSVDTLTEARIQRGIQELIQKRTSIIIAHRLSTIKNCDRILVIEAGEIQEDGDHASLIKQKGKYYQLYTRQHRESVV
ncbi:MAG: ATP-binding cassette domain-containing protein, partial [Bacteroidota bacterium]